MGKTPNFILIASKYCTYGRSHALECPIPTEYLGFHVEYFSHPLLLIYISQASLIDLKVRLLKRGGRWLSYSLNGFDIN
jgi:hypothetical protein